MVLLRILMRGTGQLAAILIITFALAEFSFRIFHHFYPSFIFHDSSYNRYRGRPTSSEFSFRLNSLGFKDVEFQLRKEAGTYRILALGDSFAFGVVPYQHNYLTLLEQYLDRKDRRVEVLNMGITGIGPEQYRALLVNEGLQYRPDMVLVSLFTGNDLTETLPPAPNPFEYSAVATFFKYLIDVHTKFEGRLIDAASTYDDAGRTFTDEAFLKIEAQRSEIFLKKRPHQQAFEGAMSQLVKIKEICDERGIALRILVIPDELQVNPTLRQKVIVSLRANGGDFDFRLPNEWLGEQFRAHQMRYLDLVEEFSLASAQVNLYKLNDTHWNIAGNERAARALAGYLSDSLDELVPSQDSTAMFR